MVGQLFRQRIRGRFSQFLSLSSIFYNCFLVGLITALLAAPVWGQSRPTSKAASRPYRPRLKDYQSKAVEGWQRDLQSKDRKARRKAIVALGDYRGQSKAAVAALIPFLDGEDAVLQEEAISSLRLIGRAAVKSLAAVFQDKNESKRFAAAMTLFTMRQAAENAVPALCKALDRDSSSAVRSMAASALGKIARRTDLSVPALVKALRDKNRGVKRNAGDALAELGPAAKKAVEPLCQMLKDKDVSLRKSAATALGRMGLFAKSAVKDLSICLTTDSDWLVRLNAAEALGFIGDKAAIPALQKAMKDKKSAVAAVAKQAIKDIKHPPEK
jgi:HEAT repeat protein